MSHAAPSQARRPGPRAPKLVVAVLAAVACATALRISSGGSRASGAASQLHSRSAAAAAAGAAPVVAAAAQGQAAGQPDDRQPSPSHHSTGVMELLTMVASLPVAAGGSVLQSGTDQGQQDSSAGTAQAATGADAALQQTQQATEQQQLVEQRSAPPLPADQKVAPPQQPSQQQQQPPAAQHASRATAPDASAAELGIAKVALMFLTRGPMPLEPVWQEWLRGAEGLLPSYQLAVPGACSSKRVDAVRALAGSSSLTADVSGAELYRRQHLFSIYVHSPPDYPAYAEDSMFYGRETSRRIPTAWASHSLVAAVRLLLRDALADPLNKRFILMSESDVPLWPAGLLYLQALAEAASRVHACEPRGPWETAGSDPYMADSLGIPRDQWRKSSQWFMVNRRHAELFVNDTKLDALFEKECYSEMNLETWQMPPGGRWCVSDEHYLPVLLAAAGEAPACACSVVENPKGTPTFTLWGQNAAHPRTFVAHEMSIGILRYVRNCSAQSGEAALERFAALLVRPQQWSVHACQAAAAASAAAAQELAAAGQAADAAAAARAAEVAALVAAAGAGAAPPPPAAKSTVLPAARAAAAVADQVVEGAVPLLPPYQCNLVLRKMAPDSAQELAQKLREGLLLSRAQAAALPAPAPAANASAAA